MTEDYWPTEGIEDNGDAPAAEGGVMSSSSAQTQENDTPESLSVSLCGGGGSGQRCLDSGDALAKL